MHSMYLSMLVILMSATLVVCGTNVVSISTAQSSTAASRPAVTNTIALTGTPKSTSTPKPTYTARHLLLRRLLALPQTTVGVNSGRWEHMRKVVMVIVILVVMLLLGGMIHSIVGHVPPPACSSRCDHLASSALSAISAMRLAACCQASHPSSEGTEGSYWDIIQSLCVGAS